VVLFYSLKLVSLNETVDFVEADLPDFGERYVSRDSGHGPATRTISRAMAILYAFDETRPELGVTDLSQLTGLDKSTVYRLLSALQQGGLVDQDAETSKYRLGGGLVRLGGLALRDTDLTRIARAHLQDLADRTQETVNLSVMTETGSIVNIEVITSPRRVRNVGWIGREMPLHAVSGGKVFMAHLPQERLEQILADGLPAYTEHTVTERTKLREALEQVRRIGYGIAEEELEEGLSAVAAPVRNHEGQVVAIISVSGPSSRLPRKRLTELGDMTKDIAEKISQQIGYAP
jgi:DNA-binding IclR family transcriptional regulator